MFVAELDSSIAPRLSYYSEEWDGHKGLCPTLWDGDYDGSGRIKVAVFRLNSGAVLITSEPAAVEFAETHC